MKQETPLLLTLQKMMRMPAQVSLKCILFGTTVFLTGLFILVWTKSLAIENLNQPQLLLSYPRRKTTDLSLKDIITIGGKSLLFRLTNRKNGAIDEYDTFRRIPNIPYLDRRFNYRTHPNCNNTCQPHDYRQNHTCWAKNINNWSKTYELGTLPGVPLFSDNEYFFPWELQYMSTPPLKDIKSLPDLVNSKIYFVSPDGISVSPGSKSGETYQAPKQRIWLVQNEPATFRVDLVDGYGRRRTSGGDEVRAWLTKENIGKSIEDLSSSGFVKDLGNGSYNVVVTPAWSGSAQLNVAVPYPKEYIRTVVHHFRIGSHRFLFGMFQRGTFQEVTLCHSTPNVPGRPCVCNLTEVNSLPYYCGKPLDTRLSCDDWSFVNTVRRPGLKNMTAAEIDMEDHISRYPRESLIKHDINIQTTGESKSSSLPPCLYSSRRNSWTKSSPRGVWSSNKTVWTSLVCKEPEFTPKRVRNCLRSTKVWMIGDSNIRHMAMFLTRLLGCSDTAVSPWPGKCYCRNEYDDITVHFRPHEYPLYVKGIWLKLLDNGAVTTTLSSIPSTGNHIVVLHYYLHFASSHLSVLLHRLNVVKKAISELISRNPQVLVAVRGPHISTLEWARYHMAGGDVLGTFIREIYINTFQDLQDKVVFLDGWDMSISFENVAFHPPKQFVQALWRTLLSYKCT